MVICPSRELAQQSLREFDRLKGSKKFKGRLLDSLSVTEDNNAVKRLDCAITTPLKLIHLLREGKISIKSTTAMVLDEADKLLDMGYVRSVVGGVNFRLPFLFVLLTDLLALGLIMACVCMSDGRDHDWDWQQRSDGSL